MTTTAPPEGPCEPWVTAEDIGDCVPGATDAEKAAAARFSTRMLWLLSGKKWPGACTYEQHVCLGLTCGPLGDGVWGLYWPGGPFTPSVPVRLDGGWQNIPVDGAACRVDCLRLPGPVNAVEVWVDGVQLVYGVDYRLSGWRDLWRLGGLHWPVASDPTLDKEEPGSFVVIFSRGRPVPQVAKDMATVYARLRVLPLVCERSCAGLVQEGLDSMSADGVTISWADLLGSDPTVSQRTGVPIVDEWLRAENPNNRRGRTLRGYSTAFRGRRSRRWTD